MRDINNVCIIGRLTRDAESRDVGQYTVVSFSVAVNRSRKDQSGNWKDEASYFDVKAWGGVAKGIYSYLLKGCQVAISGELLQERWESNGENKIRVVINADQIQLIGGKKEVTDY